MKLVQDKTFVYEAEKFALRFNCESCSLYDDERTRCAHGYPVTEHREAPLEEGRPLIFCKDYDCA